MCQINPTLIEYPITFLNSRVLQANQHLPPSKLYQHLASKALQLRLRTLILAQRLPAEHLQITILLFNPVQYYKVK